MSEYQYYEFQAIDRPLTERQMGELRTYSSRATITPSRFTNVYHWGDFKGNPSAWMEKYFDAFLYLANWGTRELTLRLPRRALDLDTARLYCCGESASVRTKGDFIILELRSEDDEGDGESEGDGWLASLIPARADIAGGDHRALYLSWLLCAQRGELDEDVAEPPCPPGLNELTVPLEALADFLRIDEDLRSVAAEGSSHGDEAECRDELGRWIAAFPEGEKTGLLVRLAEGEDVHVRAELHRRFRLVRRGAAPPDRAKRRTVAELLAAAERRTEERRRQEAERVAKEHARREREATVAREKYLAELTRKEPESWARVEALIATRRPGDYDQAVRLIKDLRDASILAKCATEVEFRIREVRRLHAGKPSLVRRLAQAGLT